MPDKPYLFLAYIRPDHEIVEKLTSALEAEGVETWRDINQIALGTDFKAVIFDGIAWDNRCHYIK